MQGRRIAQFGNCRYDYTRDVAVYEDNNTYQIPRYIYQTLVDGQENSEHYTQCIINMYEADNEIPWHLDHELFGPEVLVYTFGEDRPLRLRKLHDTNTEANRHSRYGRWLCTYTSIPKALFKVCSLWTSTTCMGALSA